MSKLKRLFGIVLMTGTILATVLLFVQSANARISEEASNQLINGTNLNEFGGVLSGPTEGEPLDIVLNYISANAGALGLTSADVANVAVSDLYSSQHNGLTHVYLQQQHNGINVFNAILNANVMSEGQILNIGNRFVSDLTGSVVGTNPAISAEAAVEAVAVDLGLVLSQPLVVEEVIGGPSQAVVFSNGGISQNAIPVHLMYQPMDNGQVRLAWDVTVYELSSRFRATSRTSGRSRHSRNSRRRGN
jgi:Zn-dependent metalloprotease